VANLCKHQPSSLGNSITRCLKVPRTSPAGSTSLNDRPDVIGTGPLHRTNSNPDAGLRQNRFSQDHGRRPGRQGTRDAIQYYGPGLQKYGILLTVKRFFAIRYGKSHYASGRDSSISFKPHNFANPIAQPQSKTEKFGKITANRGQRYGHSQRKPRAGRASAADRA